MCDEHPKLTKRDAHTQRIPVEERVLAANDRAAAHLRDHFRETGTLVINLISSPGSGKTSLLEATVARLTPRLRPAAIVGDVATERDAERLRRAGIQARQILTGGACHLDADLVHEALHDPAFRARDVLFIENVGNLVCPASFDLGEDFKTALLSVTEGDDKPFKYPGIFAHAAVTLITKIDLLPHVSFDRTAVRAELAVLNPDARVLELSAITGEGLEAWCDLVRERLNAKRGAAAPAR